MVCAPCCLSPVTFIYKVQTWIALSLCLKGSKAPASMGLKNEIAKRNRLGFGLCTSRSFIIGFRQDPCCSLISIEKLFMSPPPMVITQRPARGTSIQASLEKISSRFTIDFTKVNKNLRKSFMCLQTTPPFSCYNMDSFHSSSTLA